MDRRSKPHRGYVRGRIAADRVRGNMSEMEIVTNSDRPDLEEQVKDAFRSVWPEFIFHDPISNKYTGLVETYFPQYDVLLLDDGEVVTGGLAGKALTALRERATAAGLQRVIAPVRPTLKSRYPLTPMEHFARWARNDGLHLDPWIRAHQRLGARILGAAPQSMIISGTMAEWEDWAKMAFPETGQYIVADALDPVDINRERDRGTYAETNLWMRHL